MLLRGTTSLISESDDYSHLEDPENREETLEEDDDSDQSLDI